MCASSENRVTTGRHVPYGTLIIGHSAGWSRESLGWSGEIIAAVKSSLLSQTHGSVDVDGAA